MYRPNSRANGSVRNVAPSLKEIDAIARGQEVSRSDEFNKLLVAVAKSPLNSAKNMGRHPAQAISNIRSTFRAIGASESDTEWIVSGEISLRLREELDERGMMIQHRLVPGPLK
jgi:hypothetical protein